MWHPHVLPQLSDWVLTKGAWHRFCLVFGCKDPTHYPRKVAWHFCLVFGFDIPTYYPSYLTQSFCIFVYVCLRILYGFNYLFIYSCFLCLLIPFLVKVILITSEILHPCRLVSSRFTVSLALLRKINYRRWTLVGLCGTGPAYCLSNWHSGRRGQNCSCL